MKKYWMLASLLLLSFNVLAADAPSHPSPYVAEQPGFRVEARPGTKAGTYEVSAVVSHSKTGEVLATPRLLVNAGEWASTEIDLDKGATPAIIVAVSVDPSGQAVVFHAKVRDSGNTHSYVGAALISQ